MATITFQVAETGQTTLTKTYTLADSQLDRMIAAYQAAANVAIGGVATRAQVLNAWATTLIQGTIGYVANVEQQVALSTVPVVSLITPV